MENSVKLYSLKLSEAKAWMFAGLFIAGNIIFPQLSHLIPRGGLILLPIYFFTLIAAYKYGWKVGLVTAVLSPVINHLLFGMPPAEVLLPILIKSVSLALVAGFAAKYFGKISLLAIVTVVLAYQIIGTAAEWIMSGSFAVAVQDFRLGILGMLIQIFGGYFVLKALSKV